MSLADITTMALGLTRFSDDPMPRIAVYQRTDPGKLEAMVYDPVLCLILQGAKTTAVASQSVTLTPGRALLVSHDLPVMSRITRASGAAPYIAVIVSLDMALLRRLHSDIAALDLPRQPLAAGGPTPLMVADATPDWIDPLARYLALAADPMDRHVLGPGVLRELHYRLLMSPLGAGLGAVMQADGHAQRIAKAIAVIRRSIQAPIRVTDLARHAGMSVSAFHDRFKAVTGTTPLQYQKDLRLIDARRLVVVEARPVAEAAFAVGYESPTHFSRDYARKFGVPPSRDAQVAVVRA